MRKLFDEHDDGLFVQEDAGVFWDARERGLCQSGHLQDHSAVTCIWAGGKCKAGRENKTSLHVLAVAQGSSGQPRGCAKGRIRACKIVQRGGSLRICGLGERGKDVDSEHTSVGDDVGLDASVWRQQGLDGAPVEGEPKRDMP